MAIQVLPREMTARIINRPGVDETQGEEGERGVYTLIMRLDSQKSLRIGALGLRNFEAGYYAYVGSALGRGPMGLRGRLGRHLSRRKKPFWHIDHLLRKVEVVAVVASLTRERLECSVAKGLKEQGLSEALPVMGFGVSDCLQGCGSHLFFSPNARGPEDVAKAVQVAHLQAGLSPLRLL